MKEISEGRFRDTLYNTKEHHPLNGQIELTYRCALDCIHCCCKGSENKELNTRQWKKILDTIHKEGTIYLTLTGGDPLIREDFLKIYSHAKKRGFIITIFTNGQSLTGEILDSLIDAPPYSIEITLNGISKDNYEAITQIEGSYPKAMKAIRILKERALPLILKTNCLKQNIDELGKIKLFTEELLGRPSKDRYRFKYDPMIYPRLNRDRTPVNFRLSFEELLEARRKDSDIWEEYQKGLHRDFPHFERDRSFLYHCDTWKTQFYINPYGRLRFCQFSEKFSVDLKSASFKYGFYKVFPQILNERFKTNSKCRDCNLRPICYHCPARAYLETGSEELPVSYYCHLAEETAKKIKTVAKAL